MKRLIFLILFLLVARSLYAESAHDIYENASKSLTEGNASAAYAGFKRLVEEYPDSEFSPAAHFHIGEYFYIQQFYLLAQEKFRQFLRQFGDNPLADGARDYLSKIDVVYIKPTAEKLIQEGDKFYKNRIFPQALAKYTQARTYEPDSLYLAQKIKQSQQLVAQGAVRHMIKNADRLYAQRQWSEALAGYHNAVEFVFGPFSLKEKIATCRRMLAAGNGSPRRFLSRRAEEILWLILRLVIVLATLAAVIAIAFVIYKKEKGERSQILVTRSREFTQKRKAFLPSSSYKYVQQFVQKFPQHHKEKDIAMLKSLLAKQGFDFTDAELAYLIRQERESKRYHDFRRAMLDKNPQTLPEYIKAYCSVYPDALADNLDILETLLIEENIAHDKGRRSLLRRIQEFQHEKEVTQFKNRLKES